MKVEMTPRLEKLVQAQIDAGLYSNPLEVLENAVSLLEAHNLALAKVRGAIAKARRDVAEGRGIEIESQSELMAIFEGR